MSNVRVKNLPSGLQVEFFQTTGGNARVLHFTRDDIKTITNNGSYNMVISNIDSNLELVGGEFTYTSLGSTKGSWSYDILDAGSFENGVFERSTNLSAGLTPCEIDYANLIVQDNTPSYNTNIYYSKDVILDVTYTDLYGTPLPLIRYNDYDNALLDVGGVIVLSTLNDVLLDSVSVKQVDDYGTPIPSQIFSDIDSSYYEITVTSNMLNYGRIDFSYEFKSEPTYIAVNEYLTNCSSNIVNNQVEIGEVIVIKFTADAGYVFNTQGWVSTLDKFSTPRPPYYDIPATGTNEVSLAIDTGSHEKDWTMEITLKADLDIGNSVLPYVNLYNPSDIDLANFSHEIFISFSNNEITSEDISSFIMGTIKLPLSIPNKLVAGVEPMKLGLLTSEIEVNRLNDYLLTIDLGDISVGETYHNIMDYQNVVCELFLPFVNSVVIDNEFIINQTITIQYVVNLYDGDVTINLTSTLTGKVFKIINENISQEIPFIGFRQRDNVTGGLQVGLVNNILTPYIQLTNNIPIDDIERFGVEDVRVVSLSDVVGYVEVDEFRISSDASNVELEEIKQLLRSGVIINE